MQNGRHNLVAVLIQGGLGNQMFQYSAGLLVASRFPDADLRVNLSNYQTERGRPLELSAFGIELRPWQSRLRWWRVTQLLAAVTKDAVRPGTERLNERQSFEPRLFEIRPPCYLSGYFQSHRYVEPIGELVRRTFDTAMLSTPRTEELERQIAEAACPVMVHVRRGDYGGPRFPLLERSYYDRARGALEARVEQPTYFLFSDDPGQAKELLASWPRVVPIAGFSGLEDFRLMSLCRHFIIANSTYSWWAAWLGAASDKTVIAPTRWFGGDLARNFVLDNLLPSAWIRVAP